MPSPVRMASAACHVLALVVGLSCASIARAQQAGTPRADGRLSGTVNDANGERLAGVSIEIRGPVARATTTSVDGLYDLAGLPDGVYEVVATLEGFAPARRSVQLAGARPVDVPFVLTVSAQERTVVTAARTGERDLEKVPISVSVLSGDELARADSHTVAQLAGAVPSLTFSQNSDYAQFTLRGIGSNTVFAGTDPSVAVYLDGVYLARPVMVLADFLDLERIEVVRGPQGTLYGRNAVGGAVHLITREPSSELEVSARVTAGTLDAARMEARVSGPLVPGRVLGSVAVLRGVRDGYVHDLEHPDDPQGGEDVTAGLGKLHVVLSRRTSLQLRGDITHKGAIPLSYSKVLAVKPGFSVDNPPGLHNVRASAPASNTTLQFGGAARLTTRLTPTTTLVSLTAYRSMEFDNWNDPDITELPLTTGNVRELQRQWSQEVTISQERGKVSWMAGLFLFGEHDRQPVSVQLEQPRLDNRLAPDVETRSAATFGQATIRLGSRTSAFAGVRYTHERKTIDNRSSVYSLDPPQVELRPLFAYTDAIEHTAWTPRAGFDVRVGDDTFAYVSASRGFKSGGFNLTSPEAGRGFDPEWAWTYEAGVKGQLANGRLSSRLAVFHTDYSDLQVQTAIRPGIIDISNAASARIRGVELEASTEMTRAFRAGGHVAWLDAIYERYTAIGVGGVMGDVAGRRLGNAPEWSGRAWLEWSRPIGPARLALRADSRWQSTVYFTPFNDDVQRQRPYGLVDAGVELGPRSRRWTVLAYARNLTNEDYITGTFSSPPPAIGGRPGEPRMVGVQLTYER